MVSRCLPCQWSFFKSDKWRNRTDNLCVASSHAEQLHYGTIGKLKMYVYVYIYMYICVCIFKSDWQL